MEAVVLVDYKKQQDEELNLKVGEVITNVTQLDTNRCEGTSKNGERGIFPASCVQMRPATGDMPSSAPTQQQQQSDEATPLTTPTQTPSVIIHDEDGKKAEEESDDSDSETESDSDEDSVSARALYDYTGRDHRELSFKRGDIVEVIKKTPDGHWWDGLCGNKRGFIPVAYVEIAEFQPTSLLPPPPPPPSRRASGDTVVPGPESIPTSAHTLQQYRACVVENVHEQAMPV